MELGKMAIFPPLTGGKLLSKMSYEHISTSLAEAAMCLLTWQLWGVSDGVMHNCVQYTLAVGGKEEEEEGMFDLGLHVKSSCRTKP